MRGPLNRKLRETLNPLELSICRKWFRYELGKQLTVLQSLNIIDSLSEEESQKKLKRLKQFLNAL